MGLSLCVANHSHSQNLNLPEAVRRPQLLRVSQQVQLLLQVRAVALQQLHEQRKEADIPASRGRSLSGGVDAIGCTCRLHMQRCRALSVLLYNSPGVNPPACQPQTSFARYIHVEAQGGSGLQPRASGVFKLAELQETLTQNGVPAVAVAAGQGSWEPF